ncbi:hypothetical protein I0P70_09080 [Pontibacter sp. FD36]|uniref:SGNH/GDSL hydrolase family protein n=1 Tax=Pontibacter sp. FD36 TaxID=2789860 RepID=UPI0018AC4C0C|nr:SGNH/GDSL hydrolase family protein [Pontibacter sp. FD36]MBF8963397.1 hypothetical protein [Pontibacter sp. FD36]
MKKFFFKSSALALMAGVFLTSCDPDIDTPAASSGEADFSTYVALGNSLTAGFQDGALYREGQLNSYPAILAEQFRNVGGGEFNQPLFAEGVSAGSPRMIAPNTFVVPPRLVLGPSTDCRNETSIGPVLSGPVGNLTVFAPLTGSTKYNNLGVPGARSFHLPANGYGSAAGNPFFARFATSATTSVLADAMAQNPTFFTLWIGNNDVLGYATAGGVDDQITPEATFEGSIKATLAQLTSNGAKGVVGNIPDVSKIPFFTTVPYNGLVLNAAQAQGLTAAYKPLNDAYKQAGIPYELKFAEGPNPFVIKENGVVRQLKAGEYVALTIPQDSLKCFGLGSQLPIADKHILSEEEVLNVRNATTSFNNILKAEADRLGLGYADFNTYLNKLSDGFSQNGVNYNSVLVTGNAFSLDGIHFTPRGAALVANEFIRVINDKYNARIPKVDETQYRTVRLP